MSEHRWEAHEAVRRAAELAEKLPGEAARRQEMYDVYGLGPDEAPAPYEAALLLIGRTIRQLHAAANEIEKLRQHLCDWDDDACCSICGADGKA
jgi:ribosomal 50S subunit-associated protein YjgA (DUF615 family)